MKVLQAIKAVLNVYFECKRCCFTNPDILHVELTCNDMVAKVLLVWDLKQTLLNNQPSFPLMRKLHSVMHLSFNIAMFGALSKADAGSWESSNRYFTTDNWRRTSRRYASSNEEMLKLSICQDHSRVLEFIAACHTHDNAYINSLKPEVPPEVVLVYPMCNVKHATLCVGANGYLFACEEEIELNDFIGHKELTVFSLTDFCRRALGEQNWNSLCRGDISLKLIQALTYHANEESGIGKGSHHAMKKTRRRKQRFDFIFIQLENGDNQLAQIVSMLQLTFENDIKYFYIVQYMEPCEMSSLAFFPKYRWEVRYNRRRQQIFCHDIIDFENILDTAFIIPDFAHDVIAGEPNTIDRFWYIPRKFFDRCGWNDLENADYNQTEDMEVYMNRNGSGAIEMQRNIIQENNHAANNMIDSDTDDSLLSENESTRSSSISSASGSDSEGDGM